MTDREPIYPSTPTTGGAAADRSALVVMVPEAEPVVEPWRDQLDPSARFSMPAHITVLFPFVTAPAIDDQLVARLSGLLGRFGAFTFVLSTIGWFGESVVYLEPDPAEPFIGLTRALIDEFPDCRPYDGAFESIVPHLTIGDGHPVEKLREAARSVQTSLPIPCSVREVCLMGRSPSGRGWVVRDRLPLGAS